MPRFIDLRWFLYVYGRFLCGDRNLPSGDLHGGADLLRLHGNVYAESDLSGLPVLSWHVDLRERLHLHRGLDLSGVIDLRWRTNLRTADLHRTDLHTDLVHRSQLPRWFLPADDGRRSELSASGPLSDVGGNSELPRGWSLPDDHRRDQLHRWELYHRNRAEL